MNKFISQLKNTKYPDIAKSVLINKYSSVKTALTKYTNLDLVFSYRFFLDILLVIIVRYLNMQLSLDTENFITKFNIEHDKQCRCHTFYGYINILTAVKVKLCSAAYIEKSTLKPLNFTLAQKTPTVEIILQLSKP